MLTIVDLYLNPPENAIVLSADEKTSIQALDRTQPLLGLKPRQVERRIYSLPLRQILTTALGLCGVLAGLMPAWRATRIYVVEILHRG